VSPKGFTPTGSLQPGKHTLMNLVHTPAVHAGHGMKRVLAVIDGTGKEVAGLAGECGIAQEVEFFRMPHWVPVRARRSVENGAGNAECGGEVHGAGVVADEMARACEMPDEVMQAAWSHAADARGEHFLAGFVLIEPKYGMRVLELVGEGDETLQRPAFVSSAGSRMDGDGSMAFASEGGEVWRGDGIGQRGMTEAREHGLGDAPVLPRGGVGLDQGFAMMEQKAQPALRHMRSDAERGSAEAGDEVGGVALVIAEEAGVRLQGACDAQKAGETRGVFPGGVEVLCVKGKQPRRRTCDFIQRRGCRAGHDGDAPVREVCGKLLDKRKEDDVVAKLVHFEDQQIHQAVHRLAERARLQDGVQCWSSSFSLFTGFPQRNSLPCRLKASLLRLHFNGSPEGDTPA